MKIYFDSATEPAPVVINGNPPVDQSAQVAALTAKVAAMQTAINVVRANATARKTADAASVDGQADIDALAAFP